MLNPSLTRRINALPDTLSRLMSDPAVSESMARADESKRRLTRLLPLDGVEQSAIDEYRRDWLARYVYNSNAIEGSTLSLKDTELILQCIDPPQTFGSSLLVLKASQFAGKGADALR